MVRPILQYPAAVLRRPADPVSTVDSRIRALLLDLRDTMMAAPGVGLAAPQVGAGARVCVADWGEGIIDLINPRIATRTGSEDGIEGCLSLPNIECEVVRSLDIGVDALDRDGQPFHLDLHGFGARVVQHEIDHLDGVLILDRAAGDRFTHYLGDDADGEPVSEPLDRAGVEALFTAAAAR